MHASSSQSINIWDAKSISCAFPGLPMLDKGAHGQNIGPVRGLLCKAVARRTRGSTGLCVALNPRLQNISTAFPCAGVRSSSWGGFPWERGGAELRQSERGAEA